MTLRDYIDLVVGQLAPLYPQQECKAIAVRLLKECIVGYKGYEHLVEPATELSNLELGGNLRMSPSATDSLTAEHFLIQCIARMATGEPLQYVLGYEWFCGHKFNVAPGVLIPRPETEELVGKALEFVGEMERGPVADQVHASAQHLAGNSLRILDICTGSGCIAWSIAAAVQTATQAVATQAAGAQAATQAAEAHVYACDISQQALQIARSQQIQCADGSPARVEFFECDILSPEAEQTILSQCASVEEEALARVPAAKQTIFSQCALEVEDGHFYGKFDLIVSNPPYVCESEKSQMRTNVLEHEPHLALFVPDSDPLKFYRAIVQLSGRLLKPGGVLMFEINERFGQQTVQLMQELGYTNCQMLKDIFGKARMVTGTARRQPCL